MKYHIQIRRNENSEWTPVMWSDDFSEVVEIMGSMLRLFIPSQAKTIAEIPEVLEKFKNVFRVFVSRNGGEPQPMELQFQKESENLDKFLEKDTTPTYH